MEREPRPEPTKYFVDYDGERYILGPENTLIYLHDKKKFDHIYVQFKDSEDGEQQGTYMWRLDKRYTEQFEMMVSNLTVLNTTVVKKKDVSQFDLEQWTARFGNTATEPQVEPSKELVPVLTPRQVNLINFMSYLLLHEQLSANDFNGTGDLYI